MKKIRIFMAAVLLPLFMCLIINEIRFFFGAYDISFTEHARKKLQKEAGVIDSILLHTKLQTSLIAESLSSIKSLDNKLMIRAALLGFCNEYRPDGLFFAFEYERSGASQGYAYLMFQQNDFVFVDISDYYDYRLDTLYNAWYREPLEKMAPCWTNAAYDPAFGERIVVCGAPFRKNGIKGVAALVFRTTTLFNQLHSICGLGRYGLPYITDTASFFIAHPQDETRSLAQLGIDFNDAVLSDFAGAIKNNTVKEEEFPHYNTVTQKWCNEMAFPLSEAKWYVCVSAYDGRELESYGYRMEMKRSAIRIIFFIFLSTALMLWLTSYYFPRFGNSASYSFTWALLMLLTAILTISAYNRFPANSSSETIETIDIFERRELTDKQRILLSQKHIARKWEEAIIVDRQSLNYFTEFYQKESQKRYNEPVRYIPTGMYVSTIQLIDDYNMRITGFIWQKYLLNPHVNNYLTSDYRYKGIIFPEARINSCMLIDTLLIRLDGLPAVLYRWQFDVEVRERFSHALYPFGKHEIYLQLWSGSLDDNSMLIPDFESYNQLYPDVCPGLASNIDLGGWDISGSFYSYRITKYLCNFGNISTVGMGGFPELYFNITASRKFIDNLVCRIIPLIVVLILLYTILFVRQQSDGFNTVIGTASLFFVLIFEHINLRQVIPSEDIMFIEYCYFSSYFMLLLVTVTSFRTGNTFLPENFYIKTDRFLKRYFWMIVLGQTALVAIWLFY